MLTTAVIRTLGLIFVAADLHTATLGTALALPAYSLYYVILYYVSIMRCP